MKNIFYFLLVILFFLSENFNAQQNQCNLEGTHKNAFTVIPPPSTFKYRTSLQKTATAIIQTHYNVDNPPPINARPAIEYAVEIWTYLIKTSFNQIITIDVSWKNLGYSQAGYTLAQCGPTSYYNSSSLPHPETQYPIALAEYLLNQNLNGTNYEMSLTINSHDSINWVLSTDGIPVEDRPDLVSIVLHEVTHGLSFNSSFSVNGSLGYKGIDSFPLIVSGSYPTVYDRFGVIGSYFPNPELLINDPDSSPELKADLTSDTVFFNGDNAWIQNDHILPKLYDPTGWESGSSFTHLDETKFPAGSSNSLMSPNTDLAEVIHSPGEVGLAILQDNGWDVNRLATFIHPQPGIALLRGAVDTIKWTDNIGGAFTLKLLNEYNTPVLTICNLGNADRGLNNFVWTIPNDLTIGYYKIRIESATNGYFGVTTTFTITNMLQVAAPVFNPPPHWYPDPVNVTASCATSEATIRYTTDGNEPSITSPIFPSSLPVSSLTTIKGKAFKTGMLSSATTIATYSIGIMPTTPEITPGNGTYVQNTTFWISWPTNLSCFASMTFDGTEPTDPSVNGLLLSTNPNGTVCVYTGTARVKARTKNAGGDWSNLVERTYTIIHGVVVKQLDASSNPFGQAAYWNTHWNYVDPDEAVSLNENQNHFLSTQQFKPGTHQKFNNWEDNLPNTNNWFRNWDSISVYSNTTLVQAHFADAYSGIEIKNILEGTAITGGNILFKDPWLTDINEAPYGRRSRGLDAIFKNRLSPFYPDYGTGYGSDTTKGVFLNQDPAQTPTYYSVQATNGSIPMGGKYGTRPFYFNRWGGSGVQFEHSGNATTGVVFTSANATATAVMKGHLLSDKTTAFASNGQRNTIRDINSIYHIFYISMYKIWHTHSLTSDFNGAWSQEEEVPLAYGAYHPVSLSVDYNGSDQIAIVYVDESAFMWHTIINKNTGAVVETHSYSNVVLDYNYINSVLPVVAFSPYQLITVYKPSQNSGLYYARKYRVDDNDPWTYEEGIQIPHTSFTSLNPTIASIKDGPWRDIFFLAFQEGNINTTINYCQTLMSLPLNFNFDIISTGSGYNINYSPSISLYRIPSLYALYKPMVSWTARSGGELPKSNSGEGTQVPEPRMVCRQQNSGNSWGSCFVAGQNVNYSYNNSVISSTTNQSVIAWSESNGTLSNWVRRDGTSYSTVFCLEPAGLIPNVTTGISFSNIKAFTYDPSVMPSILNQGVTNFSGTPDCGGITKEASTIDFTYSRSGVILKNGIEFVFNTGDIINGDSVVKFIEMPDTIVCHSINELNQPLRTEEFQLDHNSNLLFTNYYYVINKEGADTLLTENESVNYKVELVNSLTSEVAGTFDNITYTRTNLDDYENISYQVNCSGIPEGNYFLRLVTGETGGAEYSLINTLNDGSNLNKKSYNKVMYTGNEVPTTYALSQNYPNPFNPATTINYQLPKTGFVTLKIYDILGKEVASLVSEQMNPGRYSVNFDASRLASGVYIYRLQVNDYVSSKKMLLLK